MNDFHDAFQSKLRLKIISALIPGGKTFKELKSITDATDGNLSVQLSKLEADGMIKTTKSFILKKPQTTACITEYGLAEFTKYVNYLTDILKQSGE